MLRFLLPLILAASAAGSCTETSNSYTEAALKCPLPFENIASSAGVEDEKTRLGADVGSGPFHVGSGPGAPLGEEEEAEELYPTKIVLSGDEAKVLSNETQDVMRGHGCVDESKCHKRSWLGRTKSLFEKYKESRIKKYVSKKRKPNYGMTQVFRSTKGFCTVKYGYSSVVLSPFKTVHLLVYSKVACSDDKVNFVTRRAYIRGWSFTSAKGKEETFGCFAFNRKKDCEKMVKLEWKSLTSKDLAKDPAGFSVQ